MNKKHGSKSVMEYAKVKKTLAITCLAIFTAVNTSSAVMAMPVLKSRAVVNEGLQKASTKKNVQESKFKEVSQEILGKKEVKSDEFINVKDMNQKSVKNILPTQPKKAKAAVLKGVQGQTYTLGQLRSMSYGDMMNAIASVSSWESISDLFQNTSEAQAFYNDTARFKYMISDLTNRASRFTSSDDQAIPTMVEVIRSGFYLGYYNASDYPGMWDSKMTSLCLPALRNMINNPYFSFGTEVQNNVIEAFGSLIGNSTCDVEITNQAVRLLRDFRLNAKTYLTDLSKSNAVFKLISGIGYVYYTEGYSHWGEAPETLPSFGKIDGFIDELIAMSELTNLGSQNQWLLDNSLYYMGQLGKFYSNQSKILQILTDRMDRATRYSAEFFSAASQIHESFNDKNARGESINYEQLQKEGNEYWMPKHYTFDDGAIVIQAGDKVSAEKIKRMYWATKEVESQFFRVYGNDKALEPNNPDKVLTIRLFNSPEEYKMNSYLNGISTDNGGMYLEPYGTFYTYERTPEESVYSLEELFRHEFTHYLQGKYQVPGMWGQGDFYKNNELEWFDEATAEFFAGSTRTEGVKPRKAIVGYLSSEQSKRFTLNKLFKSGYASGWDFYNYGWAYASYMYKYDLDTFMKINDSIMKNDINTFRTTLQNVANNPNTEAAYQKFMEDTMADNTIGTPLVSDSYVQSHAERSLSQIKSDISSVSGVSNLAESKTTSQYFSTFKLSGTYSGTTSQGRLADWKAMNAKANEMLNNLSKKGWTGYDTVTCYFTNYKVVNGVYQYDIVFRGLLNGNADITNPENQAPTAKIEATASAKVNDTVSFKGDKSSDVDGRVVSYEWNFGDNTTSNAVNPTHVYTSVGTYNVTLKVTDDKGMTNQTNFTIRVNNTGSAINTEVEPNNSPEEADGNGFISNNSELKASLQDSTDIDYYAFEVDKSGKVDVKITGNNNNISWVVYKANDMSNSICWPQSSETNGTKGSFNAEPGKYYIQVYGYGKDLAKENYSILMNGIKSFGGSEVVPPVTADRIDEQEPNNELSSANVTIYNNINTFGTLASGGDIDIFNFDVATAGKVDVKVSSAGNGYTWVVFKENDENNFVCWSQYSEADGSRGEFNATPGKYHIKLYSLNNTQVNYTVNIKGIR